MCHSSKGVQLRVTTKCLHVNKQNKEIVLITNEVYHAKNLVASHSLIRQENGNFVFI